MSVNDKSEARATQLGVPAAGNVAEGAIVRLGGRHLRPRWHAVRRRIRLQWAFQGRVSEVDEWNGRLDGTEGDAVYESASKSDIGLRGGDIGVMGWERANHRRDIRTCVVYCTMNSF